MREEKEESRNKTTAYVCEWSAVNGGRSQTCMLVCSDCVDMMAQDKDEDSVTSSVVRGITASRSRPSP